MHLLAATPGAVGDGSEAIDLGQTAGDIVVLSAADTEIAGLAAAQASRLAADPAAPSLRLANYLQLGHNMSVDLYVDTVIRPAKLVVARLLGGRGYWPYGVDEIAAACRAAAIPVAFLPGGDEPDAELARLTSVPAAAAHRLWQYLVQGGAANLSGFLGYAATLRAGADDRGADARDDWSEPAPLLRAGLYWPGTAQPTLIDIQAHWRPDAPVAALTFYRALVQAGDTAPIDGMIGALREAGLNPLPLFAASLKEPVCADIVLRALTATPPDIILNATAFALSTPGRDTDRGPFAATDAAVLQIVLAGSNETLWRDGANGLSARDIAMNVALPEVDGRIMARAISFKGLARRDPATEADIVAHQPVADRLAFTAALAAGWCRLRRTPAAERRIALVLANYPNRDGRIGNGVGLDTPAGAVTVLGALAGAGYRVADIPADGDALVARLASGPTNAGTAGREIRETLSLAEYEIFFASLPRAVRDAVTARWGRPEADPFHLPGETDCGAFAIPAFRCGSIAICLQPARGYNIDPVASYHDPALVPPHNYLAFYCWLRTAFGAHAVVHFGKHGNLEWLPGKSVALSADCFPEAALGPLPNIYPFIVNDPGEGSQAKRRSAAVIIDHLTPPLTRAGSYGPLRELERLVDEYYEAANIDPRRLRLIGGQIVELMQSSGIDRDLGLDANAELGDSLTRLDGYLCELKELQIRDGLHIFGQSPDAARSVELLAALVRLPRGPAPGDASLLRALAGDLGLDFDPLVCDMADAWTGLQPAVLAGDTPWRSHGDTVERLETLSVALLTGSRTADPAWTATQAVLGTVKSALQPALAACGAAELTGLLTGLDGRFVAPGPSGAPTRGRPDVLPTGRNFYSVDTRTVPTPAAWQLGWQSAQLLVETHAQTHGDWPQAIALSAWGTSNMRTGGDDIAQALALIGARPTWDEGSRRVTGFEIMPVAILDRPRIDVTLRVSGFFRDAFPGLIDLFDSAVAAIAAIDHESDTDNPIAARVRTETMSYVAAGFDARAAQRKASWRVFGSKPGAYGAGLQALIDERGWRDEGDLARACIAWGGYAYGAGTGKGGGGSDASYGIAAHGVFETRLGAVDAVVHNQDNREHDLLDSDDYYQFEGGLAATVKHLSGRRPAVWHNDHSRPFAPKIRALEDEISRVVRARVVNPKWIAGVMRHGYKGAFEMAATVDYLFAFAATTGAVRDDQFDLVYDAFVADDAVRTFFEAHNPAALAEMAARFLEARERGLWRARSNSAYRRLEELAARTPA